MKHVIINITTQIVEILTFMALVIQEKTKISMIGASAREVQPRIQSHLPPSVGQACQQVFEDKLNHEF